MSQKTRFLLLNFIFLIFTIPVIGQRLFTADTTHRCIYSDTWFSDDIILFEAEPEVSKMVEAILRAGNISNLPFEVAYASVPNVAAVMDREKNYLLYNKSYFSANRQDQALLYFMLAHAIGHFQNRHDLNGEHLRSSEETGADEFAGFVMRKIGITTRDELYRVIRTTPFSYKKVDKEARIAAFNSGWNRADAHLKGQGGGNSFYEEGMRDATLPLPSFTWPPPPQYTSHVLPKNLYDPKVAPTLGHIDNIICNALDARGYSQRSYFCVPNGFAMVTQLEQFNKTGTSKGEESRWVDYPVQENFDGFWDYMKALVLPTVGYFRVFVFVVTDKTFSQPLGKNIPVKEAEGWIGRGGRWLPEVVGNIHTTNNYRVTVLVYEFEATQAKKIAKQKHPCLLTGQKHLETSGLLNAISK